MPCPKSRDIYKVYIRWCGIRDWTCLISAFLLLVYCTVIQQVRYVKRVGQKNDPFIDPRGVQQFGSEQ